MASDNNLQIVEQRETIAMPAAAKIARERSLQVNKGKYKSRGACDVKRISLQDRILDFPDQELSVRGGTIFCCACMEVVSSKKSILVARCSSWKHASGKDKLGKSKLIEQTIVEALNRENSKHKDSTLPLAERAYRLEVVEEFLKAGIRISKIDKLRHLLEMPHQ